MIFLKRWMQWKLDCIVIFLMRHPQHLLVITFRPVSGLASFASSPSHAYAQWHINEAALTYRCGGSTGIAPVSRLTFLQIGKHLKAGQILAQSC